MGIYLLTNVSKDYCLHNQETNTTIVSCAPWLTHVQWNILVTINDHVMTHVTLGHFTYKGLNDDDKHACDVDF